MPIRMQLGGYARQRPEAATESKSQRALLVGGIVAAHLAVLLVWWTMRADASPGLGGLDTDASSDSVVEVIHYFDITPMAPAPAASKGGGATKAPASGAPAKQR